MTTRTTTKKTETRNESEYPRAWIWDEDGDELEGVYVGAGSGYTANGQRPFVTLDIGGELRTLWLLHDVLRNSFAREVHRRSDRDLHEGERVHVWRRERRESANGRSYVDYKLEFPDRPKPSLVELFGSPDDAPAEDAGAAAKEETTDKPTDAKKKGTDDAIPF
jgi:hypothetical protein